MGSEHPDGVIDALATMAIAVLPKIRCFGLVFGSVLLGNNESRMPLGQVESQQDLVIHTFGVDGQNAKLTRNALPGQDGVQAFYAHEGVWLIGRPA